MKEERKHSIDQLFQESLHEQKIEPSANVWASLATHVPSKSGRGIFIYALSAVLIGALSVFLFIEFSSDNNQTYHSENIEADATTEPANVPDNGNNNIITDVPDQATEILSGEIQAAEDSEQDHPPALAANKTAAPSPVKPDENSTPPAPQEMVTTIHSDESSLGNDWLNLLDYRISMIELADPVDLHLPESRTTGNPVYTLTVKDGYVRKADILFGAGFSPAVNIYPDGQNRNDYSVELIAAYEKSRFLVEGGLGVNYTTESAEYGITSSSYDSVGYYINVNSFNVDPGNPDSVFFETSLKSIYDSVDHYRVEENTNKYAYIQIPVRIGYRIIEKDRFSLDLKAGILFSLQTYKEVPDVPYEGNDVEQIAVIRQYPDRLKTNWQYTAGIGLNYHINRQLRFTLEPYYRQYINSVYSTGSVYSARSPYAFGIRGGIYFHF